MSNLAAFLSMVGKCEGADYSTLYGGGTFSDCADHPRIAVTEGGYTSTAAGRYQILAKTWDDFIRAIAPSHPQFNAEGQDWCAQWLLERRGALADVNAGRLEDAIKKAGKEWASLPGSPYGQPTRSLQFCLDAYLTAGGTLGDRTDAPAPIEDQSTEAPVADDSPSPFISVLQGGAAILSAVNPLFGGLASVLINAFAPLAKEKIASVLNKHTDNPAIGQQVADSLVQGAIALTGKNDPVQATAAAQNDSAILAQLQQQTLDHIDKLAPVLDKLAAYDDQAWAAERAGRDAAAARAKAEPWDMTRMVVIFSGATSSVMVAVLLAAVVWPVLSRDAEPNTALLALAGPLFMASIACWKDIFAYRFDGTKESGAKDVVISQLAQK